MSFFKRPKDKDFIESETRIIDEMNHLNENPVSRKMPLTTNLSKEIEQPDECEITITEAQAREFRYQVLGLLNNQSKVLQEMYSNSDSKVNEKKLRNECLKILTTRIFTDQSFTQADCKYIVDQLVSYVIGFYKIESLIDDLDIAEVRCLAFDNIRYKKKGVTYSSDIKFADEKDYKQFVNSIAVRNKNTLSELNGMPVFTDVKSSKDFILRIIITDPMLTAINSPYMIIRKQSKRKKHIEELIREEMMTEDVAEYLRKRIKNKKGLIVTGQGGAGKTTFMNALIEEYPFGRSGEFIQESDELFADKHPDMMFKHVLRNKGEGRISYELDNFTEKALLEGLDLLGIGEIKGKEAASFIQAAYTGQDCWCTVHGQSAQDGIYSMANYIMQATGYDFDSCLSMMTGIHTVVFMDKYKVREICEVYGFDFKNKRLMTKIVYKYGSIPIKTSKKSEEINVNIA